jgi:hypothetical protein
MNIIIKDAVVLFYASYIKVENFAFRKSDCFLDKISKNTKI